MIINAKLYTTCALAVVCGGSAALPSQAFFVEPDVQVLHTFQDGTPTDNYGFAAETIGDIDGDNVPDFVISAPRDSSAGPIAGAVYVYSGASGGLIEKLRGEPFSRFGFGVAAAGDVDGDGVPDIVIGAPGAPAGPAPQVGRVHVYSGATRQRILTALGSHHLDLFGFDVDTAGDVNSDGHADIVVGARTYTESFTSQGAVTVISGADGMPLWTRAGAQANAFMGAGVSGIGDVTGDGRPDVAAAADGDGPRGTGYAYIFSGVDGALVRRLTPNGGSARRFGQFFVHAAGDVDADGISDIYVGDYQDSPNTAPFQGRGYVFSGATGERVRMIVGEMTNDGLGGGRGIGDVDGDGHGDLLIASYFASYGAANSGRIYIFSGKNGKVLRTMTGTVAGRQLGVDAVGLGDLNGDGKPELLVTGFGAAHVIAGR